MSTKVYFKTTGPHEGKTVDLGPNREYHFIDGVMELEGDREDLKNIADMLKRYYGVVQTKAPSKNEPEDAPKAKSNKK